MQQVGSYNYAMEFTIAGFDDLTDRDWHVIITRPDGSSFERFAPNDVEILDAAERLMGVRIIDGDHTIEGTYKLQVWDETDGASLRSHVMEYTVLNSLTPPEP